MPESYRTDSQQVLPRDQTEPMGQVQKAMTGAEMRWRVVHSLPRQHQNYLFDAIRKRCGEYLAKQRFAITERELVSQLWIKLMAGVWLRPNESVALAEGNLDHELAFLLERKRWNELHPDEDIRTHWLLNELNSVCSFVALRNLCVDIDRQAGRRRHTVAIEDTEADIACAMKQE